MSVFIDINELIELPLLGGKDFLMRGKGRLLKWSKFVFNDLNLNVIRNPIRQRFQINKRTNTIDVPCSSVYVSSVSVEDRWGNLYPVWKNHRLNDDIPDVKAAKNCACEYNCGHVLCNTIKGYEAIISQKSDKLPNGNDISFTCVDRKGVLGEEFYEEKQYPMRQYLSGIWVDTILYTERKTICKVQVDSNGCICDTEENAQAICGSCCETEMYPFGGTSITPPKEGVKAWIYYCNSKMDYYSYQCGSDHKFRNDFKNIYNISEDGDRLIFPPNFGHDYVVVRWYKNADLANMKIPIIAAECFADGLLYYDTRWDMKLQNIATVFERKYTASKWGLLGELNKYRIAELRMMTTPPVYMPTYDQPYFPAMYQNFSYR